MMDCAAARNAMLEAERADLQGLTDSPLATHLQVCAACRERATRLAEAERLLGEHLAQSARSQTVANALERARSRARTVRQRRRRIWTTVGPVLAAAGLVVALLSRTFERPTAGLESAISLPAPTAPLVETNPGQYVAVLATDNPEIVIVWTF